MQETMIQTHCIVTETYNEFHMNWCGRILDTKPKIKDGKPIFVIVSSGGRMEINTTDMGRVEKCAKLLTRPKGRGAVSTDTARVFLKEEDDNEVLMGVLTHNYVKKYAPMQDAVGFRE